MENLTITRRTMLRARAGRARRSWHDRAGAGAGSPGGDHVAVTRPRSGSTSTPRASRTGSMVSGHGRSRRCRSAEREAGTRPARHEERVQRHRAPPAVHGCRRVDEIQADLRPRGCLRRHRLPLQRRQVLRRPGECAGGQLPPLLLRSRAPPACQRPGESAGAGPVAHRPLLAVGEHIQGWLDGTRHLDHRDARFTSGRVGLWTKADSITAFDDLTIRGVRAGSS